MVDQCCTAPVPRRVPGSCPKRPSSTRRCGPVRAPVDRVHSRHGDGTPSPVRDHARNDCPRAIERSVRVHSHRGAPLLRRHIDESAFTAEAGLLGFTTGPPTPLWQHQVRAGYEPVRLRGLVEDQPCDWFQRSPYQKTKPHSGALPGLRPVPRAGKLPHRSERGYQARFTGLQSPFGAGARLPAVGRASIAEDLEAVSDRPDDEPERQSGPDGLLHGVRAGSPCQPITSETLRTMESWISSQAVPYAPRPQKVRGDRLRLGRVGPAHVE